MKFYKYQGTGNDFVMIDNRTLFFPKNNIDLIARICDRRFGVGADGLILLEEDPEVDFRMMYYNSDGKQSSMCGNGGRCIVAFAKQLQIIDDRTTFRAVDGVHFATIQSNIISLQMKDVEEVKIADNYAFVDTGSPHHIVFVDNLEELNVKEEGAKIRYSELYANTGSNVNFVKRVGKDVWAIRTYERGVEDETLSCGTGATAVAIAIHALKKTTSNNVQIQVKGGHLRVSFQKNDNYEKVLLIGNVKYVFEGEFSLI